MTLRLLGLLLLVSLASCSDEADTQTQRSTDSGARESIEPSAIINDTTRLPDDSSTTTVSH